MTKSYVTPTHTKESMQGRPAKAPFGYYGAKLRIAKQIIEKLPPHNAWVEAFCGSAAITLAKEPVPIEVINDADGEIVNVFMQLRTNAAQLCELVALTPYSREEFGAAKQEVEEITPLERARRFLVSTMMTVNSVNGPSGAGFSFSQSYSRGEKEARVNRWYNLPPRLEKVVERLRGIRIENRDACDIIDMFSDRPATLLYLDPPYFVRRDHKYTIDANDIDFHKTLLKCCQDAQCMILISGYENDLYGELLVPEKGWMAEYVQTQTRNTSGKVLSRTEVLWMNKKFLRAKEAGIVPIQLTEEEKRGNKVNPPRTSGKSKSMSCEKKR